MLPIHPQDIQTVIDRFTGQELYLHLELTTGAYASHLTAAGQRLRRSSPTLPSHIRTAPSPARVLTGSD